MKSEYWVFPTWLMVGFLVLIAVAIGAALWDGFPARALVEDHESAKERVLRAGHLVRWD